MMHDDYTRPFKDKYWMQQTIQVQTAKGPADRKRERETILQDTKMFLRDLDDSLRRILHAKHKLGQSNQNSLYFQLWDKVQPFTVRPHGDALWNMSIIPDSHSRRRNILKYRTCQIWNKNTAFQTHVIIHARATNKLDTQCPLCQGGDSQGHMFGNCMHPDMSKQYIYAI